MNNMLPGLRKIKRRTVAEDIADQLRAYILNEGLAPGDRLPGEQELCDNFGASRVSVREALKLLEGAGLITVKPGAAGGIQVARPAPEQWGETFAAFCHLQNAPVEHLIAFRIELEQVAAAWAAERATPEHLHALMNVVEDMSKPGVSLEVFHELDIRFHTLIAEASGNEMFVLVMHAVRYAFQRAIFNAYAYVAEPGEVNQRIIQEHREIVALLQRKDAQAAARAVREHIRGFYAAVLEPPTRAPLIVGGASKGA
jgi:GntR family transcriptional repressor for pyruvate dehydrogenase complex